MLVPKPRNFDTPKPTLLNPLGREDGYPAGLSFWRIDLSPAPINRSRSLTAANTNLRKTLSPPLLPNSSLKVAALASNQ